MTDKHTQGPWTSGYDALNGWFYIQDSDARMIVVVKPRGDSEYAEIEANARLIVSAPAMLEALREAHDVIEETHYKCDALDDDYCAVEAAGEHATIRKITAALLAATGARVEA